MMLNMKKIKQFIFLLIFSQIFLLISCFSVSDVNAYTTETINIATGSQMHYLNSDSDENYTITTYSALTSSINFTDYVDSDEYAYDFQYKNASIILIAGNDNDNDEEAWSDEYNPLCIIHVLKNMYPAQTKEGYLDWVSMPVGPSLPTGFTLNVNEDNIQRGAYAYAITYNCTLKSTSEINYTCILYFSTYLEFKVSNLTPDNIISQTIAIIPLFVVLFIVPFALKEQFGIMGFLFSLIVMIIIAYISNLITLPILIFLELCVILIIYYLKKKKEM